MGVSTKKEVLANLYEELKEELPDSLGFDPEMNLMVGLNILSIGWPIKGILDLDRSAGSNSSF
jgi:hypothetical protein